MTTSFTINGNWVGLSATKTIWEAAQELGIFIPTLCYKKGYHAHTSCMLCCVEEQKSGKLLPSCTALAQEGMQISTDNARVKEFRKRTLELLLSEHTGDCEAPCTRICPAHINLPKMIRMIQENRMKEAIAIVKQEIPFPRILGRICPAPCEKGCRRKQYDSPVAICDLKRFAGDESRFYCTEYKASNGKKIAIVGAGPAGLSCAFYLAQEGYQCEIFDDHPKAGGMLRYGVDREKLPESVLDEEIESICQTGITFFPGKKLGKDINLQELSQGFQGVVVACGKNQDNALDSMAVHPRSFQSSIPHVFIHNIPCSMAVQACANGKRIAYNMHSFLQGKEETAPVSLLSPSLLPALMPEEIQEFAKESSLGGRVSMIEGNDKGYLLEEAKKEASRCLHCDCHKVSSCLLKKYAQEYNAKQKKIPLSSFIRNTSHSHIVHEPGKCIKCGLCVKICEEKGEAIGMSFLGRGFSLQTGIPFQKSLQEGVSLAYRECVESCPVGALAWKKD
ncbi:MAG: (2Fe-2S)-binding protein [Candidatus Brocadiae bacterium]|nr:(2Fe-2S)-binding protein [Candidatus Brocadiia bacterium]